MKRLLIGSIFLLSVIFSCFSSYSQTFEWVRGGGSTSALATAPKMEAVYSMCTDYNGNVYSLSVVGYTAITADTFYLPSASSSQNILFTSHNCNGQMRFAKFITGTQAIPYGVTCDISGHVYVAFMGLHTSRPLKMGYDTTITGDIYRNQALAQFDTTGNYNWIRFVGPNLVSTLTGAIGGNSFVAIDNSNNVHFINSMKYGVEITPTLTSHWGTYDLMYDVSGNLLSANKLDIDSSLQVYGAIIDKQSNKMYIHGYRNYGMFPDSSMYSYIAALDISRNRIWIDTFTNPYYPGNVALGGIAADGHGHLYTTPNAARSFIFRGDTALNAISTGSSKIASIMKLDTGGSVKWIKTFSGNTGVNSLLDVTLMPNDKIATSGVLTNKIVSGLDTMYSYTSEGQNAYFTVFDSAGYLLTLQQFHGVGFYDLANTSASDRIGNLYIGGKLENNIWAGTLSPYTSVGGDSDYFIMKYGVDCSCTAMPVANYIYSGSTDLIRSFTYTGTSSGIDSVKWIFGDGNTSSSMSPVHTYTGAGTYTTCVRVYSACGNDMRCKEITVTCSTTPTSGYIDTGNLVRGFTYTGTMAGYDSVVWVFGDGNTDTGLALVHTYAVADTYHVCAKVYTNCGTHTFCNDIIAIGTGSVTAIQYSNATIKVYPNPSKEELNVSGILQETSYRILNVVGVTTQHGVLQKGNNTISIQNISSGVLILEMTANDGSKNVVRIVKE